MLFLCCECAGMRGFGDVLTEDWWRDDTIKVVGVKQVDIECKCNPVRKLSMNWCEERADSLADS